jgi:hypothetical protein
VKCNYVHLQSCIRNVNKHFYRRCQGGSQYLLSVYRLHKVILTSIISLTDLSAAMWLFVVVTGKCFIEPESPIVHHSFLRFMSRFISIGLLGFLIRQVSKKSNRMDPRMSFKQLADETLAVAWEHYHGFMTDLPTAVMKDWEFDQGFYCKLSQEAKEHIDALAGGTFFMLNAKKVQALLEKLSATERESEEYGLKEDSHTTEIDPLTRKFQGVALTQSSASEMHQVEQEILAQPSDGKKMPLSWISSDAILNKHWNSLSRPALPIVPCILGPFKVHHALCDWGASMNILPQDGL